MAKFAIFIQINVEAQNAPGGPDMANIFKWDLRRWSGTNEASDVLEGAGPTLATGSAPSVLDAKAAAEVYASFYAQETAYVFEV